MSGGGDLGSLSSDRPRYAPVPDWMLRDLRLSATAVRVWGLLDRMAQRERTWPGQERVALDTGISERSVRRAMVELADAGWVSVRRRGQGKTNHYTLHDIPKSRPVLATLTDYDAARMAELERTWASGQDSDRPPVSGLDGPRVSGPERTPVADKRYVVEREIEEREKPNQPHAREHSASVSAPDPSATPPSQTPTALTLVPPADTPAVSDPPGFRDWYQRYPKKIDPRGAERSWKAALKRGATPDEIQTGTDRWIAAWEANGTPKQYIANPTTFLNQDRWTSEPVVPNNRPQSVQERTAAKAAARQAAADREMAAFVARHDTIDTTGTEL